MRSVKFLSVIALLVFLSGCSWFFGASSFDDNGGTPSSLFRRGWEYYHDGDYREAIESFQRVTEEYPLSKYAVLAELGIADSHFGKGEYLMAEGAYSDFIDLHPTNENLPYVMYQIGMCNFQQISDIDRDQTKTRLAREAFEKLIARFPSSKFSFMAEKRLRECKKRIAEHIFYVGHYYFKMGKYEAALKRFKTVAGDYANLGLDYKVSYFIHETQRRLGEQ